MQLQYILFRDNHSTSCLPIARRTMISTLTEPIIYNSFMSYYFLGFVMVKVYYIQVVLL